MTTATAPAIATARDIRDETERSFREADYHGRLCRCCEREGVGEGILADVTRQGIYATDPLVERGLLNGDEREAFLTRVSPLALESLRRVIIDELAIEVGGRREGIVR